MAEPETFTIQVYSGPDWPNSVWAENWHCPSCQMNFTPDMDFSTKCPLHNPLYCTGSISGDNHPMTSCTPFGEVFFWDYMNRIKTIIGKVDL